MPHHSSARGHQHEQEGAEEFGEKSAPFLARVIEIVEAFDEVLLVSSQWSYGG
jgi:hypothetical protein